MDDEAADSGGRAWKSATHAVMFAVPMLMLIWITCYGFRLTVTVKCTKTHSSEDSYMAILFGVVTVIFGLAYFIVGLTIVADLALDLLAWLQQEDDPGTSRNEGKEQTTKCQIFVHTVTIMVSMFMLVWTIYYGYMLAANAKAAVIYNRLAFLIGVISMAFGFIYFIIGMGILAESALHLPGKLHQVVSKSDALLDRQTEV